MFHGVVAVPLTWEEEKHVSCLQSTTRTVGTLEPSLSLRVIKQLVLIEDASLLDVEVVAVCMSTSRVRITRGNLLMSDGTDCESPEGIAFVGQQVFTDLHGSCLDK